MKTTTGVLLAALILLSGCSFDDPKPAAAAPTPTATPATGLRETCADIEAGLPSGFVPPASAWVTYEEHLTELYDAGDTETQNALDLLIPAVSDLAADPESGTPLLDARDQLRTGLDLMATRCRAVGSSALQ